MNSTSTDVAPARTRPEIALLAIEAVTSVSALTGGVLLMVAPDGSLLMADPATLDGTAFTDWLLPGAALTLFVGVGFAVAAANQWRRTSTARVVSLAAGVGLVLFEVVQFSVIGFHPLQAVFGAVGVATAILAWRLPPSRHGVA